MARTGKRRGRQDRRGARSGRLASSRLSRDFDPDYSAIKKDLRRIAGLTGFFLGILVILSIILR